MLFIVQTARSLYAAMLLLLVAAILAKPAFAQPPRGEAIDTRFIKHTITGDFISEGVAVADINSDGKMDIIAGAYWFEAPGWTKHSITTPQQYAPATQFSNSFLNFSMDVNQDGWADQVRIGLPGEEAVWYENPANNPGYWKMHAILANAGNESPAFVDIDGDGRADILCNDPVARQVLWLKSPLVKEDTNWQRFVIAKGDAPGTGRYTHGLGWIDMNADGRKDIVITKGWWECPTDPRQPDWIFHAADLGDDCSQIYGLAASGAGNQGLVSASAHNFGIWWHEKTTGANGKTTWKHHIIFNAFSQSHGLAMADINHDGYPDLITGKRYFAHNGKDPGAFEPAVLYWFERKPGKIPQWIPHLIDDNSGVGLQVVVQDINNDGWVDIVVANKKGVFFFEQKSPKQSHNK